MSPNPDEERFAAEVCACGHGAGWHAFAWLDWKQGRQTDAWCEFGADMPDDPKRCVCSGFELATPLSV